jgi:flagellar basal-body rod protein FlgG
MNPVLAVALQSMQSDMARMDQVAMNLANAQTVGYKRDVLAATPFSQLLAPGDLAVTGTPATRHMDRRPGALKPTGQALDLALAGPGWFEVRTEEGLAYTRQGDFRSDAQGRLVTARGHPVLGTAGEIRLPPGVPVIDAEGRVYEGGGAGAAAARLRGEAVAQIKVVQFDPAAVPLRRGDGLVSFGPEARPVDGHAELRQGFLEGSNVSSMQEMVQLLQTVRHFESLQKVAVGYDEMLGNAVRKLGDTA